MEEISAGSFCFGLIYGFFGAGIIAVMANRMREARLKIASKNRSYDKFPDAAQPNLTASGIVQTSNQEWWLHGVLSISLLIFILLLAIGALFIVG